MQIDIFEVIDAASTKPFGFTPYFPGPGLGGHCIPIDPFYLSWKAKELGMNVVLAGHYATETFGVFSLEKVVSEWGIKTTCISYPTGL